MTKDDLNSLAWPAMRYALGRKTYVVDTVCSALKRNAKDIRSDIRIRMGEEIASAINKGDAGMDMHVAQWEELLHVFSGVI